MECQEIKEIIPKYFRHTASEKEIQQVEEHLCVCHDCRTVLGELMDQAEEAPPAALDKTAEPALEEKASDLPPSGGAEEPKEKLEEKKEDIEYFPGDSEEVSMDKVDEILGEFAPAPEAKEKPQEAEPPFKEKEALSPTKEEEEGVEDEDASFEVLMGPPSAASRGFPVEPDVEVLKEKESNKTVPKPEMFQEDKPLPEDKSVTEAGEDKAESVEEPAAKDSKPAQEAAEATDLPDVKSLEAEEKETLPDEDKAATPAETSYSLDGSPLTKSQPGLLEYLCLYIGLGILGILIYLLTKG
ncbi:MAG: zf-HC2 domain-containing protein [Candidatus Omnitrophota bacterium]